MKYHITGETSEFIKNAQTDGETLLRRLRQIASSITLDNSSDALLPSAAPDAIAAYHLVRATVLVEQAAEEMAKASAQARQAFYIKDGYQEDVEYRLVCLLCGATDASVPPAGKTGLVALQEHIIHDHGRTSNDFKECERELVAENTYRFTFKDGTPYMLMVGYPKEGAQGE